MSTDDRQDALAKNFKRAYGKDPVGKEPSDKVPDMGVGENFVKQSDAVAHAENLKRINEGEPAKIPTPEELAKQREKAERFRTAYGGGSEGIGANVRQELGRKKEQFDKEFTPPVIETVDGPEKEGELSLASVAKLFLLNDDKMTDYAEELRQRCNCDAKHPIVVVEVPGPRDVKLIWRGESGITVIPCE